MSRYEGEQMSLDSQPDYAPAVRRTWTKPLILDLFCGAGGAAMGYHRAGFDVWGVDINPQPNYPFKFTQCDALKYVEQLIWRPAFIHMSPPCQAYTTMNNRWGSDSPPLINEIRELVVKTGIPYIMENVVGAKREMINPVRLTGEMFGLRVHRPRLFECSIPLTTPPRRKMQKDPVAIYGRMDGRLLCRRVDGSELRAPDNLAEPSAAMDIDWMTWDELRESIPPAYTHYLGLQMMSHLLDKTAVTEAAA